MKRKHIDWTLGLKCDHRVWPWPWIFKVKYGIYYISAKNGRIAMKRKANVSVDLKAWNVTIGFDLGHDLDLEFPRSNMEFAISLPKMVPLPWNEKQTYRLNSRPQMWPSDLTLAMPWPWIFKVNYGICYISTKSGLIATKWTSKHIDWTPGLKCDQWVWPWPWPWDLNIQGQMWSSPFGDQDSDRGDFRCWHAVDSSSYFLKDTYYWKMRFYLAFTGELWGVCCEVTSGHVFCVCSWWRHQLETFSALLALCAGNSPVFGEFPSQRPVTWSFAVFFDLRLNKRLSKQSWGW